MRKPRRETLGTTGLFHKMWRGHNREPVLESPIDKNSYITYLQETYSAEFEQRVAWYSFCLMTNHAHETGKIIRDEQGSLEPGFKTFGDWMRNSHGRFGAEYNRRHQRQGKVAYDRPKTTEIKDDAGVLQVMFYGDANPVRAGMVSHPSKYRESSYLFYAYGNESPWTKRLTAPPAYLALGRTAKERQAKYRSLCDTYLRQAGLIDDRPSEDVEEPLAEMPLATTTNLAREFSLRAPPGDRGNIL